MGRTPKDVTEAELAILQALWEAGPATIRLLTDTVYPEGGPSEYATVKKLLARLEGKACVRRDRTSPAHRFEAVVSQEDLIDRRLQAVADHLCDGSRTPLLMHLLQTEKLSAADRKQLREYLDNLKQQSQSRGARHARSGRSRSQ